MNASNVVPGVDSSVAVKNINIDASKLDVSSIDKNSLVTMIELLKITGHITNEKAIKLKREVETMSEETFKELQSTAGIMMPLILPMLQKDARYKDIKIDKETIQKIQDMVKKQ